MGRTTAFRTPWLYRMGLVLAVALGVLAFVTWPRPDNRLAEQSYAQSLARLPAQQNAYFAILGLGASAELDPVAVAQRIVADFVATSATDYHPTVLDTTPLKVDIAPFLGAARYPFRDVQLRFCRDPKETPDCVQAALSRRAEVATRLVAEHVFVQRVIALRQLPSLDEPVRSDLLLDSGAYRTLGDVSDLLNASIAIDMETPALREAALQGLEQDVLLWTRLMNQASSWSTRYVHQRHLQRKYSLMSALMRRHPDIVTAHRDLVARITQPLTAQTTPLKPQMDEEYDRDDLWGSTRLLELQRQIALAQIPAGGVAKFLAEAGPALADPITKLPMHYDAARHSISFVPRNKSTENSGSNQILL